MATDAYNHHSHHNNMPARTASPLTLPGSSGASVTSSQRGHTRKHSQNAGMFEPTLPSTGTSNLSQVGMSNQQQQQQNLSASQIAAQTAYQHQTHLRQRSQTVPMPGADGFDATRRGGQPNTPTLRLTESDTGSPRDAGGHVYHNGLLGDRTLNATTAANLVFPRIGGGGQPPSPRDQPQTMRERDQMLPPPPPPPPPPPTPPQPPPAQEKQKSKVKLFSRPGKIGTKAEPKEKPLPSPSKIGSALASLQRGNFSQVSLVDTGSPSLYSLANSSSATIRPIDTPVEQQREGKEKRHHLFSRQKHKAAGKDDYHLSLASTSSLPTPGAPHGFNPPASPVPSSASTSFAKAYVGSGGVGGGGKSSRKNKDDKGDADHDWLGLGANGLAGASAYSLELPDAARYGMPSGLGPDDAWPFLHAKLLVVFEGEDLRLPVEDFNRVVVLHLGLCIQRRTPNVIVDDVRDLLSQGFASLDRTLRKTPEDRLIPALVELWMFTFTQILPTMQAVFLPLDQEFAGTGSLMTPEQARDFWGGVIATPTTAIPSTPAAEDPWNGSISSSTPPGTATQSSHNNVSLSPASAVLDVRRLVLTAFRDVVILPRADTLRTIFSRLSLEFLPSSLASLALASPPPIPIAGSGSSAEQRDVHTPPGAMASSPAESAFSSSFSTSGAPLSGAGGGGPSSGSVSTSTTLPVPGPPRPGTAMSNLDPGLASYNSTTTTLLGSGSGVASGAGGAGSGIGASASDYGSRSRAISNVSFGSGSDHTSTSVGGGYGGGGGGAPVLRPYTPSSLQLLGSNLSSGGGGRSASGSFSGGAYTYQQHGRGFGGATTLAQLRERDQQNAEDNSKQVTEMVGRMLQCMSVLAGVGSAFASSGNQPDDANRTIEELCRLLKLNWLGRGRTGRNRRGMVGGRVRRDNKDNNSNVSNRGEVEVN